MHLPEQVYSAVTSRISVPEDLFTGYDTNTLDSSEYFNIDPEDLESSDEGSFDHCDPSIGRGSEGELSSTEVEPEYLSTTEVESDSDGRYPHFLYYFIMMLLEA